MINSGGAKGAGALKSAKQSRAPGGAHGAHLWGEPEAVFGLADIFSLLTSSGGAREEGGKGAAAGPGLPGGAGGPHRAAMGRPQWDHLSGGGSCCAHSENCTGGRSRRAGHTHAASRRAAGMHSCLAAIPVERDLSG